jgi:hypothetical protein
MKAIIVLDAVYKMSHTVAEADVTKVEFTFHKRSNANNYTEQIIFINGFTEFNNLDKTARSKFFNCLI